MKTEDPKFKDFTQGDLHIILYSKSWYVETNTMDDLRQLIAKICWLEPKYLI